MNHTRFVAALSAVCLAAAAAAQNVPAPSDISARLTAKDLRADVSFLASDALQGRGTPSPGLDIAAEFIASEFRRAGLDPAGDDGYFQTAGWPLRAQPDKPTLSSVAARAQRVGCQQRERTGLYGCVTL